MRDHRKENQGTKPKEKPAKTKKGYIWVSEPVGHWKRKGAIMKRGLVSTFDIRLGGLVSNLDL